VLKMRGSTHDKSIREYTIDGEGIHIGKAFRNIGGIISGTPMQFTADEAQRMGGMFEEGRRGVDESGIVSDVRD